MRALLIRSGDSRGGIVGGDNVSEVPDLLPDYEPGSVTGISNLGGSCEAGPDHV